MKKIICIIFGFFTSLNASAASYADIWWNPSESGWGVTFAQQQSTIFATFYIYGADGKPYWVTAILSNSAAAQTVYTGPVYSVTGSPFTATPFNPANTISTQVGTASVNFQSGVRASISYAVNGAQIVKTIERFTLAAIPLAGSYSGKLLQRNDMLSELSGVESVISSNTEFIVTVAGNKIDIRTDAFPNYVCMLTGTFQQFGTRFSASGIYKCSDFTSGTWTTSDLTVADDVFLIGTINYSRTDPAPTTLIIRRFMGGKLR
jgi:hypothetical protein